MKRRILHMNPPIPDSVHKEEMQSVNVDANEVIIECIMDTQGNRVKKLKPLQHVHSDNNLPDVPEDNFLQKREITINSYSETISSDTSSDDDT